MGRKLHINETVNSVAVGHTLIAMPDGRSYSPGDDVILTDEQYGLVNPHLVGPADDGVHHFGDLGAFAAPGDEGAGGASGVGFDFVTVDAADPPTGTDGQTWMEIVNPTFFAPTWEAATSYGRNAIVQPVTPNGHWYHATNAGTSDAAEPTWVTDGSTASDNDITWQDDGLIADQSLQPAARIYVFKDGDWSPAINGSFAPADEGHQAGSFFSMFEQSEWGAVDANTITRAQIALDADGNGITLTVNNADDTASFAINLDETEGVRMGGSDFSLKAFGDQALAFYNGDGVEAVDLPTAADIIDLAALTAHLVNLGLLAP